MPPLQIPQRPDDKGNGHEDILAPRKGLEELSGRLNEQLNSPPVTVKKILERNNNIPTEKN